MRKLAAACLALLTITATSDVRAYCRTSSCSDCPRDPETGCTIGGTPVAWSNQCVSFSMNEAAASVVELETARALMQQAFLAWQSARCPPDGQPPSIGISDELGTAVCEAVEYNENGPNANVVVFREESWPYTSPGASLAATRLKFSRSSGEIYDADMEVNATLPLLVEGPTDTVPDMASEFRSARFDHNKGVIPGQYHLLSILTHEAGHFLGLDHSSEPDAVMRPQLEPAQRTTELADDDVAAICAAYPPEREAPACDPTPRGGFSARCAPRPQRSSCSAVHHGGGDRTTLLFVGLSALCFVGRRRRALL